MTAPALWIAVPILMGAVVLVFLTERGAVIAGGLTCLLLALTAMFVPIDEALLWGPFSLKIGSTFSFLGRNLVISRTEGPLLAVLFGISAMWFFGAEAAGVARRMVPGGLAILGLMIASIAVEPFLYAAILIELAALAAIPLLAPQGTAPGRATVRFLIYQTLAMPCLLLAGWLLAGVETSPGDLALTVQATVMLSLGFAFLLAVFPLNEWIPGLMGQSHPYITGFLLWILPNIVIVFGLSFLDSYAWLRSSPNITGGMRVLGLIMLATSGIWAALEDNLRRIMGHAVVAETGLILLATSAAATGSTGTIFAFFIPRGIGMALWAMALTVVAPEPESGDLTSLHKAGRTQPWAGAALVMASLSAAGFPLLAGFPPRIDVWSVLAAGSPGSAVWFLVGLVGLMIAAVRQLAMLLSARGEEISVPQETLLQRGMLGLAMLGLVVLGFFPRGVDFLTSRLPLMLEHLGR